MSIISIKEKIFDFIEQKEEEVQKNCFLVDF